MNTASIRLMFAGQAVLLATGQIILLAGILPYTGHSPLQPLGNLAAAAGYGLSGGAFWILVTRLPVSLIGNLRPAFLIFGLADILAAAGTLAFLLFDLDLGDYPGYTITAEVVNLAGVLLLAAAWFCWLTTGSAHAQAIPRGSVLED